MASKKWERFVEREYLDADFDFLENVLPVGNVGGASFGLISDATEYEVVNIEGEKHIKPGVSSLDSILKSLKSGGAQVSKKDALQSVERFAQIWEEQIKSVGKWEEMIRIAQEEGEIKSGQEIEEKKGFLGRISKLFGKK